MCIVQDDSIDWESHVAHMGIIYENAHLVIAAGSSPDSNTSFLHAPNRPAARSVRRVVHNGQSSIVSCRALRATGIHDNYQGMYGDRDPLDERAWTLQERLLATRVVMFSSTEVQWVCKTHRMCEAGHTDSQQNDLSLDSVFDATDAFAVWHRVVNEYSRRRLTFASDKLPALAGIASKLSSISGSRYLAGLWRDNLIRDLCWERHLWEIVPWTPTDEWRAPSFSWVSVQGNVLYNDEGISGGHGTYLTDVLESSCAPLSAANPFGAVVGGFVRLHGPLREARIHTHPYAAPKYIWSHILHIVSSPWKIELRADVPLRSCPSPWRGAPDQGMDESPKDTALRASSGESTPLNGARAWLLIVGFWNQQVDNHDMWISCIVLGESARQHGAYERLGFVNTHWPPWGSKFPHVQYLDLISFVFGEDERTELTIV